MIDVLTSETQVTEVADGRLRHLPDQIIQRLQAPVGTTRVQLHNSAPKSFHLAGCNRKLTSDSTFALQVDQRIVCFALQAEDTTGQNISSLLGKSALAMFCQDTARPITIEIAIPPSPPTGKR